SVVTSGDEHSGVALGDLNRDGILDIVTSNVHGQNGANVSLGKGDGTFAAPSQIFTSGDGHMGVVLGDLNRDGILDIVTTNASGPDGVSVNYGLGNGTFASPFKVTTGGDTHEHVALGDVNGDGRLDIVTSSIGPNGAIVNLASGNGDFLGPVPVTTG